MREIVRQARRRGSALAAAVVALGFFADVDAGSLLSPAPEPSQLATPLPTASAPQRRIVRTAYFQRRGGTSGRMTIPQKPVNIDSSPMIDGLNKALRAIDATEGEFDGHREKAINHIHAAISDLGIPNAKGKSNAGGAGKNAAKSATTAETQADTVASLRKARVTLFDVHHKLTDKASTKGRIHADAEVRIAISEVDLALKTLAPAAAPAGATAAPASPAPSFTTRPPK